MHLIIIYHHHPFIILHHLLHLCFFPFGYGLSSRNIYSSRVKVPQLPIFPMSEIVVTQYLRVEKSHLTHTYTYVRTCIYIYSVFVALDDGGMIQL